jgi:hypothetical protein
LPSVFEDLAAISYPFSRRRADIFNLVSSLTPGFPFKTIEMVDSETFAIFAISLLVNLAILLPL